jgi:uncharacterized membrane protein YebE (DUF533 family)
MSECGWEVDGVGNVIRLSSARARAGSASELTEGAGDRVAGVQGEGWRARQEPRGTESDSAPPREEGMLEQLDRRDRLRLVEFVCSFAWADLEIQPEERVFISRLIRRLDLDEQEDLQIQQWLDRPPRLDDLDPMSIPPAHRRIFVEEIEGLIEADGEVSDEERDSFEVFKQLLAN